MQSSLNGNVTYLALQRLTERAWDEGDMERVMMLSRAVDQATILHLNDLETDRNAI